MADQRSRLPAITERISDERLNELLAFYDVETARELPIAGDTIAALTELRAVRSFLREMVVLR